MNVPIGRTIRHLPLHIGAAEDRVDPESAVGRLGI